MALYEGSRSKVRVAGGTSDAFEIRVGVHQGSALSPLLFVVVMEEATKECRTGDPWELLYADDLVLTAEAKEEVERRFIDWRQAMERRGLKVNMAKTKMMVTGKKIEENIQVGRFPCGVCGNGVGVNSILCTECDKWCHKRCSGLRKLNGVVDFCCPTCVRRINGGGAREEAETIEVDGGIIEEVKQFCYLGDMLDSEGGVERAIRTRVATTWMKWREIAGLLINKSIPLKNRGRVFEACIRSVLLYGSETWALTKRLEDVLVGCDRRMLRYMTGVTWRDGVSSEEVARRCGLKELSTMLRVRRLRWFGHVERRDGGEALGRVVGVEVAGRRPPGRPRKTWRRCVGEDLAALGIEEEEAMDRNSWKRIIDRLTS